MGRGVGHLGHSLEEVGSEREGVLLGWGTAFGGMQLEAEGGVSLVLCIYSVWTQCWPVTF